MLRVWVNLLQNPYFLLDIPRNPVVDVNLAVIGQALVDSCSPQEKKLTKVIVIVVVIVSFIIIIVVVVFLLYFLRGMSNYKATTNQNLVRYCYIIFH